MQRRRKNDSDKPPGSRLVSTRPNGWPLGRVRGRGGNWGCWPRHIQGGWRAIVTQGARIASRSGRLRFRLSGLCDP